MANEIVTAPTPNGAPATATPKAGLEDIIAGQSNICFLDGKRGILAYHGYNIHDLVKGSFEETAYLLFYGKLPNVSELSEFSAKLIKARELPKQIKERIASYPKNVHPMAVIRTIVSELSFYDQSAEDNSKAANIEKGIRLMSQIPLVIASYDALRNGRPMPEPKANLGHAANFLFMLLGKEQDAEVVKMFDSALTLHADHEFNASTFTCRVIASTLSDIYSAVTGAIGALKGPLHGGANEQVMRMLLKINDPARAKDWIIDALARKEKIMGFGHRVYRTEDPRATHLRKFSEEMGKRCNEPQWYKMSRDIEQIILQEKKLYPNVDFYSASTYHLMGIPLDLYTPIFAMSRITGWCAHALEQYSNNRIIRPAAEYTGPIDQTWIPVDKR
ncbi:MAG: citrate synthase [Bacteroidota bacterium]|nr:citrate synthase [Bacteroidota bacterium]MDP4231118.1 citrate synthase [Bacteroidota bacterium]MDP4235749.1 citrate synthase [Bacteroidota bacterium]